MSIKHTLHCNGRTDGKPCKAYVGVEGKQPPATQLRLKAAQLGWTKRGPKDFCKACSERRALRTCANCACRKDNGGCRDGGRVPQFDCVLFIGPVTRPGGPAHA